MFEWIIRLYTDPSALSRDSTLDVPRSPRAGHGSNNHTGSSYSVKESSRVCAQVYTQSLLYKGPQSQLERQPCCLCGYWDQSTDLGVKPGQRPGNQVQDLGARIGGTGSWNAIFLHLHTSPLDWLPVLLASTFYSIRDLFSVIHDIL